LLSAERRDDKIDKFAARSQFCAPVSVDNYGTQVAVKFELRLLLLLLLLLLRSRDSLAMPHSQPRRLVVR